MTATTIGGVPTLVVNELNANVLTTGVLNADRINVDGATINKSPSGALQIKDLGVSTLKIAGQAVTIPSSLVLSSDVNLTGSFSNILSLTWTSTGAPTVVFAMCSWDGTGQAGGYSGSAQIKHGNSIIKTWSLSGDNHTDYQACIMMNITPSVGSNTVSITGQETNNSSNIRIFGTNTSLFLLETKK